MKKNHISIGVVILVYFIGIILFCFFHYKHLRSELIGVLDQKLTAAIHSTRAILGENFHDHLTDEYSISAEKDYEYALKLYHYAKKIEVEYLYSFKKFSDEILFVVSSATEEELALNSYQTSYHSKYPEMDDAIILAFNTQTMQKAEYHDRWGYFRSIFIPFTNQGNEVYVMGADISIEQVNAATVKSVSYAFFLGILLGLLILPIIIMLLKSLQREWQSKYQLLFKDELTGLPNRNQLDKDLATARNPHLALIEIMNFNDVINTYGPAVGDFVIQQFAVRLNNFKHKEMKNIQAYNISGDVFAVFNDQPLADEFIRQVSQEYINYLENHNYRLNKTETLKLAITVGGVSQYEDTYMLANMALEEAKNKHVQSFVFDKKTESLPARYQQIASVKQQIIKALEEGNLVPFFQPIYHAKDLKIAKYECLARIIDSSGKVIVTPDLFIPVSRRIRKYAEITRRMVNQSIAMAQQTDCIISINLSISDIMNGATRHYIFQHVKDSKIADRIQFEILETEAIDDLEKVRLFISKLQVLGAKVGIDDMGRSYSNFDRLTMLPFDFIKIDGSIITSIENDIEAQTVTKSIVKLAHKHNIKVTAEYCHNQATTDMAIQLGVDYLQGFYLGKPAEHLQK